MEIRKTRLDDLDNVLSIFDSARSFMRRSGNMVQWTNGYPGEDVILQDIQNGSSHVCLDGVAIAGVFSLIMGEDPTYAKIYKGGWLNDRPYGTIHRIAVGTHNNGVATFCLDWCFNNCLNLRIDTHEDNTAMRNLLNKNGFSYCGVIYLPDGFPRLVFQKADK